jgi:tripartite-type tricarboxylate transporter receptor subunit TctC
VQRGDVLKLSRRNLLTLAASSLALCGRGRSAEAQTYPARPLRLVVGFPPGGAGDILARLVGQALQESLGQPCIIENRPGAGGNIATEAVVRSPPDGYTLVIVGTASAINVTLYEKLNYDFVRDIAPIAGIAQGPLVVLGNPSFPVRNIHELIAHAKANPGTINMASGGSGTPSHVAGELFKMMTGVSLVHVPYRGSAPALNDLIGGQVQLVFDPVISSIAHIKSGRLRALAVTTTERSELLPDLPTVSETVPGYEATIWNGIGAPRGTPTGIIERINAVINAALARPETKARLADLGATPLEGTAAEFGKLIADETRKWAEVVKASGAKPD